MKPVAVTTQSGDRPKRRQGRQGGLGFEKKGDSLVSRRSYKRRRQQPNVVVQFKTNRRSQACKTSASSLDTDTCGECSSAPNTAAPAALRCHSVKPSGYKSLRSDWFDAVAVVLAACYSLDLPACQIRNHHQATDKKATRQQQTPLGLDNIPLVKMIQRPLEHKAATTPYGAS